MKRDVGSSLDEGFERLLQHDGAEDVRILILRGNMGRRLEKERGRQKGDGDRDQGGQCRRVTLRL